MGNFVFSLTGRGKIVGIQVLNASEVLLDYNINSGLNQLENVQLLIVKKEGCLVIGLILCFEDKKAKISIPLMNLA